VTGVRPPGEGAATHVAAIIGDEHRDEDDQGDEETEDEDT
jgi:hypothetical protein